MGKKQGRIKIAALPIRQHKKHGLQICLITSRKRRIWIVPTGKPEKKLRYAEVAQLEAYEEAGLLGRASRKQSFRLNATSTRKGIHRNLHLYPMKVRKSLNYWPEDKQRQRKWIKVSKLEQHLSDRSLARKIARHLL